MWKYYKWNISLTKLKDMDMEKRTSKGLVSWVYNVLQVNKKRMSTCLEKSGKLYEFDTLQNDKNNQ